VKCTNSTRIHTYESDVSSEIPYQMGHTQPFATDKLSYAPETNWEKARVAIESATQFKRRSVSHLSPLFFVAVEANGRPSLSRTRQERSLAKARDRRRQSCVHSETSNRTRAETATNHHQRQKVKKRVRSSVLYNSAAEFASTKPGGRRRLRQRNRASLSSPRAVKITPQHAPMGDNFPGRPDHRRV
jgi:hypothetical protein